jgi:hypothetical protein
MCSVLQYYHNVKVGDLGFVFKHFYFSIMIHIYNIFTYTGKDISRIIKIFKEPEIKVAFRTRITVRYMINPHLQRVKYEQ